MENEISQLAISKLRNEEVYGFLTLVADEFQKIASPAFDPRYFEFTARLSILNEVLERERKNVHTRAIAEEDDNRDAAYRGLAEFTRASLHHFIPEKAVAAQHVDEILTRYGNPTSLPYVQENGVLSNLVEDLDTADNRARLATYGAIEWLDELKASNGRFTLLYVIRNEEQAAAYASVPVGAVRDARLALARAYQACVTRLNALAEVEGPGAYTVVIANVNQLIRKQRSVINARKAKGKVGEREAETGNGDQS
jgi:hypothetical protein